jgi:hypothetical protein
MSSPNSVGRFFRCPARLLVRGQYKNVICCTPPRAAAVFWVGERAVRLSLPPISRIRLLPVVVILWAEDTVPEPGKRLSDKAGAANR